MSTAPSTFPVDAAGTQYTGTIANYDVVGGALVLANTSPPQTLAVTDPGVGPYGALICGSLKLPCPGRRGVTAGRPPASG